MSFECACGKKFSTKYALSNHGSGRYSKKGPCAVYMQRKSDGLPLNVYNIGTQNHINTQNNDNSVTNNDNSVDNSMNITNNVYVIDREPCLFPHFSDEHLDVKALVTDIKENYNNGYAIVIPHIFAAIENGFIRYFSGTGKWQVYTSPEGVTKPGWYDMDYETLYERLISGTSGKNNNVKKLKTHNQCGIDKYVKDLLREKMKSSDPVYVANLQHAIARKDPILDDDLLKKLQNVGIARMEKHIQHKPINSESYIGSDSELSESRKLY